MSILGTVRNSFLHRQPAAPQLFRSTSRVPRVLLILLAGALLLGLMAWAVADDRLLLALLPFAMLAGAVLFVRYPFGGVLLWLLVYPFFIKNTTSIGMLTHWGLYRLLIPGMLWGLLILFWARVRPMPRVRFGLPEWAMFLFLLWAAGDALLLSQNRSDALIRLYDRSVVPFCMYWLIRLLAPTEQDFVRVIPVALFIVLSQAVVGLSAWIVPQSLPREWLQEVGLRTIGTLANPAVYSSTLLLCGLLLVHYARHARTRWQSAVSILLFVLALFCVFLSFSRGSWLAGAIVGAGLFILYPRPVLLMLAACGLVVFFLSSTVLADTLTFANDRLNAEHTAESRIITNAASWRMIEAQPWFGWGYDNYDFFNAQHKENVGEISAAGNINTSHNTYLTIAAELGLPALVLYLIPTLWWLVQSVRRWQVVPRAGFVNRSLLVLLWLALLAHFTVSNFMDMVRFNIFGTTLYWMVLALIATIVTRETQSRASNAGSGIKA